jgi:hypothetical protein
MENVADLFGQMWDMAEQKAQQVVEATSANDCDDEEERKAINTMRIETVREAYLKMMLDMYNPERTRGMMSDI